MCSFSVMGWPIRVGFETGHSLQRAGHGTSDRCAQRCDHRDCIEPSSLLPRGMSHPRRSTSAKLEEWYTLRGHTSCNIVSRREVSWDIVGYREIS